METCISLHEAQEMCKKSCSETLCNIVSKGHDPIHMKNGINDDNSRKCEDDYYYSLCIGCFSHSEHFSNDN